ncbi:MAG: sodium/sugar symporter [Balneolales bacterium]|nr:sodium/sugar symporter [Balneolales bacterium]
MNFSVIDFVVFFGYCFLVLGLGLFIAKRKKTGDSEGYFLASKSLPWWAVGTSLIAANISAEQMIGMSGSGYVIGLAIASYEWMAAITLIIVAKFMLPVFLKKGIYTMPQFLEQRFDERVRASLAVFWILVYIFVNLTSVLYLGALSLETILGIDLMYGVAGLAIFAAIYTIYGGLNAVAFTDVIQVFFLVVGGLMATFLALNAFGGGEGAWHGMVALYNEVPEKFEMILDRSNPHYQDLPGLTVLLGGMWVANISYWGFNQYIIQRALAAKNLAEAQRGLMFAGYLKLLMPLIVVVPGIVVFGYGIDLLRPDEAYPWLLNEFVGIGFRGLVFAALIAAIASSLASMTNSTATIFTLDIYKIHFNKEASEKNMVRTGRIVSFIALLIAVMVAPMLADFGQAFQFIQEFTGFVSPGVVAIFMLGLFWKRATANGALWAAILTIPLSFLFKWLTPGLPFLDRMGVVFLILCAVIVLISLYEGKKDDAKAIHIEKGLFKTDTAFNIGSIGICAILAVLYLLFW